MTESQLLAAVHLKWGSHPRVRLWRSNAGKAWVPITGGGMRPVQVNVAGCPDLIGWVVVEGRAVFLGIETKSPIGTLRDSQRAFQATLTRMGGLYIVARSVEDVDVVLEPLLAEAA